MIKMQDITVYNDIVELGQYRGYTIEEFNDYLERGFIQDITTYSGVAGHPTPNTLNDDNLNLAINTYFQELQADTQDDSFTIEDLTGYVFCDKSTNKIYLSI